MKKLILIAALVPGLSVAQEQPAPQQKELIATCMAIQQQRNSALDQAADLAGKIQALQDKVQELEGRLKRKKEKE